MQFTLSPLLHKKHTAPFLQTMLDTLETINWDELNHAYGRATDAPEAIRSLISSDEDQRTDAVYDFLLSSVWHQGTTYSATPYVIPFIIELLSLPNLHRLEDWSRSNMLRHLLNFLLSCSGHELSWPQAKTSTNESYCSIRDKIYEGLSVYNKLAATSPDGLSRQLAEKLIHFCRAR